MNSDPYSSPEPPKPDIEKAPLSCPLCGAQLAVGWTEGSLRWFDEGATALARFKGGRQITGAASFSITLGQVKHKSRHCETCGLTIILPR